MKAFRALTNAAILAAVLIAVALLLTGCIVEPIGPYGHERPYYSGWRY